MRAQAVPEAEIAGFIGHRAYGGYVEKLRASCVLEPGYVPERKAQKKEP